MKYSSLCEYLLRFTDGFAPNKVKPLSYLLRYCATTDPEGRMILDPTVSTYCKVKMVHQLQAQAEFCCECTYWNDSVANRKIVFCTDDPDLEEKINQTLAALHKIGADCCPLSSSYEF